MCGRLTYASSEDVAAAFEASIIRHPFAAAYNGAPSQHIPVLSVQNGRRFVARLKWGLVPAWSNTGKPKVCPINAVSEEVHWKPTFRDAWEAGRRCLVPVTGWYEWPGKVPTYIRRADGRQIALAGLWDCWTDGAEKVVSVAILTREPTPELRRWHHRQPVLVRPEDIDLYLDREAPLDAIPALFRADYPARLEAHAVSPRVNSPRNEGPELVEPVGVGA